MLGVLLAATCGLDTLVTMRVECHLNRTYLLITVDFYLPNYMYPTVPEKD